MGNNSVAVGNDINYDYLLWHEQIMIGTRILAQCATPTRGVVPAGPPVIITSPLASTKGVNEITWRTQFPC